MQITLKAARINAGLTQIQAGLEIGVSRETIRSWEKGKTYPNPPLIKIIESVYGVTYSDIKF